MVSILGSFISFDIRVILVFKSLPRTLYIYNLEKINFSSIQSKGRIDSKEWNDSYSDLLAVSLSMLDELQLPPALSFNHLQTNRPTPQISIWGQHKITFVGLFLLLASIFLWSFNTWVKWNWLTIHPKRIALYISFQCTFIFIATLLVTGNKQGRFIEWLGVTLSIIFGIISLIA
ncbi:hypothetical protein [Paraflavitalea speifideaquila]|uniref:hypothetical protein n=1 Tax=Paraflavitalea speifideaquila TaxID=3076558 RepID=UPI0028E7DFE6|nr:hypothetical protein [Paraflavitalea speifideiaquila]